MAFKYCGTIRQFRETSQSFRHLKRQVCHTPRNSPYNGRLAERHDYSYQCAIQFGEMKTLLGKPAVPPGVRDVTRLFANSYHMLEFRATLVGKVKRSTLLERVSKTPRLFFALRSIRSITIFADRAFEGNRPCRSVMFAPDPHTPSSENHPHTSLISYSFPASFFSVLVFQTFELPPALRRTCLDARSYPPYYVDFN